MTNHFQILIVGGGNAGISVAAQLLNKQPSLSIGIIEPSEKHFYQPAWTLVGAGEFAIEDTVKAEKAYIPVGSTWIKDAVQTFEPTQKQLTTRKGETYRYDILIVAPGIQIDWAKVQGLQETLGKHHVTSNYAFDIAPYTWELIQNFNGGVAVFTNPNTAIKCGGAPHKIMYLACDYWRKKGILDKCEVHYISGASILFGVKEYAETLQEVVHHNHIHTHYLANTTAIDGAAQVVLYEQKNTDGSTSQKSMHFDFCHVVPPQSAPDFIKASPLADAQNPLGYVEIDKNTMQHKRFPEIFALGDCTNAPCSKTGAAIRKQAPVVVENVLATLAGKIPTASYTGYSACPIPTQYGKLMLAEFDYSNTPTMTFPFNQAVPRWSMWMLKKYVLPWLYWHKILRGTA